MKLKSLLEGYAWERKADGSLPTLKDAISTHQNNLQEKEDFVKTKHANLPKHVDEQRDGSRESKILDLVSKAEDMIQNLRSNMSTNSVLQFQEKMGYLEAFNELLDILGDIGFEAEYEE